MLMRHAKSAAAKRLGSPNLGGDGEQSDHARPLNAEGHRAAAAMRTALRAQGLIPDVVLVSSARRTLQTLEALEPWDDSPLVEPMDRLYLATVPVILQVLRGVSETVRSVLVIGHNPGLHELAIRLLGGQAALPGSPAARLADGFPPGALAVFTLSGGWGGLEADGRPEGQQAGKQELGGCRLEVFLCPRDLPELTS
jgi:phosphohistidine phosphatase